MKIAVAGAGRMGTAITRRLIETGHEVRIWNRTAEHAHGALRGGAKWVASPHELVNASEMVISFLRGDAAVEHVYLGDRGLLVGRVEGRLFVDMSTVSPGVHARIAPAAASRGASFIECPVSGSLAAAQSGALIGFGGGEEAAFELARPVLKFLCRRVEYLGPLGSGARMRVLANLLLGVVWQALGESLLLVDPGSIDK